MSAVRARLQDIWYGGRRPGLMLRLLAGVYGAAVELRRTAYRRGWLRVHRVDAPVVVVGNFVAGGSGKTPLVIALVEHLRERGWKPGVVSRGYGRRTHGQVVVDAHTTATDGGDEPVLIARRTGAPVVVDADRVAAARRAIELGCDIVVADDGLQHLRLHRDLEIEVVEAGRRYGNGRLLPSGPLREPVRGRIDLRIENGADGSGAQSAGWRFDLCGDSLVGADGARQPMQSWQGRRVHAVAGIGNPRRFFDSLRAHGLDPVGHAFADHRAYTADDLEFDEDLPILMTEKDWVKCAGFAPPDAWALPVRARIDGGFLDAFDALLASRAGADRG